MLQLPLESIAVQLHVPFGEDVAGANASRISEPTNANPSSLFTDDPGAVKRAVIVAEEVILEGECHKQYSSRRIDQNRRPPGQNLALFSFAFPSSGGHYHYIILTTLGVRWAQAPS